MAAPHDALVVFWTHRPRLAMSAACALPFEKGLEIAAKIANQRRW